MTSSVTIKLNRPEDRRAEEILKDGAKYVERARARAKQQILHNLDRKRRAHRHKVA